MLHSIIIRAVRIACILALATITYPPTAPAGEPSPPQTGGAGNYLIPVPPDLPQRLTDANKRAAAIRAAEEVKTKNGAEHARNATAAEPTTPPKAQTDAWAGILYH
jgi:hypothetical protein